MSLHRRRAINPAPLQLLCLLLTTRLLLASGPAAADALPAGFVHVKAVIPGIQTEMRYYTGNNFIGERIDGYERPVAILTTQAATALAGVQEALFPFGLGLKIYDAYRPQRAVDQFVAWAADLDAQKMKAEYYPDVPKNSLLAEGYIAARSGHSRGSTVDLTIVALDADGGAVDMGTPFDFFSPLSWPSSMGVTAGARANRMLLQTLMREHGFKPLQEEWWHFTLENEPYPDTYFDFPVR